MNNNKDAIKFNKINYQEKIYDLTGRKLVNGIRQYMKKKFNMFSQLNILTWNMRSLNEVDYYTRDKKINFIRSVVKNYQPDIIYLIDVNKEILLSPSYNSFFDNRNNLFIRKEIVCNVNIEDNLFILKELNIVCTYYTPKKDIELESKLTTFLDKDFIIIGDVNLKSNKSFMNEIINNRYKIYGEETLQTLMIFKYTRIDNFLSYTTKYAPSDHQLCVFNIAIRFKASSFSNIIYEKNFKEHMIENILSGNVDEVIEPKLVILKRNIAIKKTFFGSIFNMVINNFFHNNSRGVYLLFNINKDLVAGKFIGNIDKYTNLTSEWILYMKHDKFKNYRRIDDNLCVNTINNENFKKIKYILLNDIKREKNKKDLVFKEKIKLIYDMKLVDIHRSKSNANNSFQIQLKDVYLKTKSFIDNCINNEEKIEDGLNNLQSILSNIIKYVNKLSILKCFDTGETFFLKKNKKSMNELNRSDTRMIYISPIIIQCYESIVFKEISNAMTIRIGLFTNKAFAGISGGSTFGMFHALRKYTNDFNVRGFIKSDITSGYDNVNLSKLENMLDKDENLDARIKKLIKIWIVLISNADIWIGETLVKQTRGIAMGYSLSPCLFVYYINYILSSLDFFYDDLFSYIDDLVILIHNSDNIEKKLSKIVKALNSVDMSLKIEKTEIVINAIKSNEVKDIKEVYPKIQVSDKTTILGKDVILDNGIITSNEDEYCNILDNGKVTAMPSWLPLKIKKLLYNGKFIPKFRFNALMFSINDNQIMKTFVSKTWSFFNRTYQKLSHIQLMTFIWNMFRMRLNAYDIEVLEFKVLNELILKYGKNIAKEDLRYEMTAFIQYKCLKNHKCYIYAVKCIMYDSVKYFYGVGNYDIYLNDKDSAGAIAVAKVMNEAISINIKYLRIIINNSFIKDFIKPRKVLSKCKEEFLLASENFFKKHKIRIFLEPCCNDKYSNELKKDIYRRHNDIIISNKYENVPQDKVIDEITKIEYDRNNNINVKNLNDIWRFRSHNLFQKNIIAIIRHDFIIIQSSYKKRIDKPFISNWSINNKSLNSFVQEKLFTNIESIDVIIRSMNITFDESNFNISRQLIDWASSWNITKSFTNYLWNKFNVLIIETQILNKYQLWNIDSIRVKYVFLQYYIVLVFSKFMKDYWFINQLFFMHITMCSDKEFIFFQLFLKIINKIINFFKNSQFNKLVEFDVINELGKENNNKIYDKKMFKIDHKLSFNDVFNLIYSLAELIQWIYQIRVVPCTKEIQHYIDLIEDYSANKVKVKAYKNKLKDLFEKEELIKQLNLMNCNLSDIKMLTIKDAKTWYIVGTKVPLKKKYATLGKIARQVYFLCFILDLCWSKDSDNVYIDPIDWLWQTAISIKSDWTKVCDIDQVISNDVGIEDDDSPNIDIDLDNQEDDEEPDLDSDQLNETYHSNNFFNDIAPIDYDDD